LKGGFGSVKSGKGNRRGSGTGQDARRDSQDGCSTRAAETRAQNPAVEFPGKHLEAPVMEYTKWPLEMVEVPA
jgi:hypothetical protein